MNTAQLGEFAAEVGATIGKLQRRVAELEATTLQLCVEIESRVGALERRIGALESVPRAAALERPMLTIVGGGDAA
jgi:hypothetical protein